MEITDITVCYVTEQNITVTINRTLPTHGLVGHKAQPNLTLDGVSHNQQNSTNPRIGWALS
jgi:hypothetical protein